MSIKTGIESPNDFFMSKTSFEIDPYCKKEPQSTRKKSFYSNIPSASGTFFGILHLPLVSYVMSVTPVIVPFVNAPADIRFPWPW